jgi:hypothetical protein
MSTGTLSEDVVGEILLRLDDVATLFRCATACKRWHGLVANPFFLLRRQWPPSLVGYFTTSLCLGTDSSRQLAFVPLPGCSPLGTRLRALSSFPRPDDAASAAVVDSATPLATRDGLLLLRLYEREDDQQRKTFISRLSVCNPLAGTWDVLPKLNCQSSFKSDYGCDIVLTSSPSFKVMMIGKDKYKSQFNLHTFVSGVARWRAPTRCFDMLEKQAALCRGYAHWLFVSNSEQFHVLNLDVETGHVSLTKLLGPTLERPHMDYADDDRPGHCIC